MQLRLVVAYDGTRFRGWQRQAMGATVQGELERALGIVLREPVRVRGAGRTDAGVHACAQVAAVRLERVPEDLSRIRRSVNALLPDDIAVSAIELADDAFDPRRDATSRVYEYRIWRAPAASPFWRRWSWHVPRPLDLAAMQRAAGMLVGERDFAAFCGADPHERPRTTVRRVIESAWREEGPLLVYRIEATAFLKHMVRNIVGTLVEVGSGSRPPHSPAIVLAERDRTRAGPTAPAAGLVLVEVLYGSTRTPPRP